MQYGLDGTDNQGMPGVVSALKAHHATRVLGQPVDDLALAFVTPLGADYHDIACHFFLIRAVITCTLTDARHGRPNAVAHSKFFLATEFFPTGFVPGQVGDHDIATIAQ